MSTIAIRPFRRADRHQLTALVDAHVAAVVPGVAVPVNEVLNQLEDEPAEFLVDPWVAEHVTPVADQRERVAAAALMLRYRTDDAVGPALRGAGESGGCRAGPTHRPPGPAPVDGNRPQPATRQQRRAVRRGRRRRDRRLRRGGHQPGGRRATRAPARLGRRGKPVRCEDYRRRGVATWLLSHAAAWLRLGGASRLLAYAPSDEHDEIGLLEHVGFVELTRTQLQWVHRTT